MDKDNIVELCKKLNVLADQHQDLLNDDIEYLRQEQSIDTPDKLEAALIELEKENRLLNIGIVGRVKAGKSSLLNALFFDGESILPKAATPMTAALTTLSYGQSFGATVEFFSEEDFTYIDSLAKQFEHQLDGKKDEILKRLSQQKKPQNAESGQANTDQYKEEELRKLKENADKLALKEMMSNERLWLMHEQSDLMKASGLLRAKLKHEERIAATSPKELASKLSEFVGVGGLYMPFCKVVHIHMPFEALRDIRVIDTPGMNDPVQSREARTLELLKTCDVVFIVSPAGQFLYEQDQELMDRVTGREGVRELVLIASQVDLQLHGDEKWVRLNEALASIRRKLALRASSVLSSLRTNNPEVGDTFDRLIHATESNLLHSSGLCHSLSRCLDQPDRWDAGEKQAWDNLTQNYPDYFSVECSDTSRNSLMLLANTEAIHKKLAEIRANKDQITQQKIGALIESKQRGLHNFRNGLINLAKKRIEKIQGADIDQLNKQQKTIERQRDKLAGKLEIEYQGLTQDFRIQLKKALKGLASNIIVEAVENTERHEGTTQKQETTYQSGMIPSIQRYLGLGGLETKTRTVLEIKTHHVVLLIENLLSKLTDELFAKANESSKSLDPQLSNKMVPLIKDILGQEADADMIEEAVLGVIRSLPKEEFKLGISLPERLKRRGQLQDKEAEDYRDEAQDFINNLNSNANDKITAFTDKIEKDIPNSFSEPFVIKLDKDINELKEQITSRAMVIDRLNGLIRQAQGIAS